MPSIPPRLLLALALGGAASLADELVWIRIFSLELGGTAPALALVLSTFFGGLALGSALAARRAPRSANPLREYAALEAAIGTFGASSVPLIAFALNVSGGARGLASLALLLPTLAMGATLPYAAAAVGANARSASRLYAVNTIGGALGAAAAGFFCLEAFGFTVTLLLAAVANFAAALLARGSRPVKAAAEAPPSASHAESVGPRLALLLAFAIGAVSIAAEVVLNRLLYMVLGGTTYAITATLVVFLAGIALGSWIAAQLWPRLRNVRAALSLGLAALGVSAALAVRVLLALGERMRASVDADMSVADGLTKNALVALAVLGPPALISGALFPLLLRARGGNGATSLGAVYAVNTLGAIAASLVVTFALVPSVGLVMALTGAGLLAIAASAQVARTWRGRACAIATLAAVGAAPFVVPVPVGSIRLWLYDTLADDRALDDDAARARSDRPVETTRFIRSGVSTTAAVYETRWPNGKTTLDFAVNGKKEASTDSGSMRNQLVLGHLPMLLHASPRRALVVGLGAGVTAGAVAVHPGVDVTIAELSPEVPEATRHFSEANHAVLDRANVHLVIADGRRYLAEHPRAFDVVTSDPIHPWVSGAANLYTVRYFELVRDALTDGGVAAQWLPLYEMSEASARAIFGSFASAFPVSAIWISYTGDSVLIGFKAPTHVDVKSFAERAENADVARDLRAIRLDDPLRLLAGLAVGMPESKEGEKSARLVEEEKESARWGRFLDDPPRLEFAAARDLYRRNTVAANLVALAGEGWSVERLETFLGASGAFTPRLAALLSANLATTRASGLVNLGDAKAADAVIDAWVFEPDGEQLMSLLDAKGLAGRIASPSDAREKFMAGAVEARRARMAIGADPVKAEIRLRRATGVLQSSIDSTTDPMVDRAARRQLGVLQGELRDYAGALDTLKPALERAPDDSSLLRVAARALAKLGHDAEAKEMLDRAAAIDLRPAER